MNWSLRLLSLGSAVLASVFVLNHANAGDQSITGKKLLLKPGKLVLISKDPAISTMGSDAVGGADSSVSFDVGGGPVTFDLPKANWSGSPAVFKYKNKLAPGGPSAVKVAKVKAGLLKVVAKGLPFPVPSGAATINIVFNLDGGTNRYCATFTGTGDGNSFLVKDAAVGSACPPAPTPTPSSGCDLSCPFPEVLIGVSGEINASGITQIQGKCGVGSSPGPSDFPNLAIHFTAAAPTATCGTGGGDPFTLDCPTDMAVRKVTGTLDAGNAVIGLLIGCVAEPLDFTTLASGPGGFCINLAPVSLGSETLNFTGAPSGASSFGLSCGLTELATGLSTTAAGTVLSTSITPACIAIPDPVCTDSCS